MSLRLSTNLLTSSCIFRLVVGFVLLQQERLHPPRMAAHLLALVVHNALITQQYDVPLVRVRRAIRVINLHFVLAAFTNNGLDVGPIATVEPRRFAFVRQPTVKGPDRASYRP